MSRGARPLYPQGVRNDISSSNVNLRIIKNPLDEYEHLGIWYNHPISFTWPEGLSLVQKILRRRPQPKILGLSDRMITIKVFRIEPTGRACTNSERSANGIEYQFLRIPGAIDEFGLMLTEVVGYARANRRRCSKQVVRYVNSL